MSVFLALMMLLLLLRSAVAMEAAAAACRLFVTAVLPGLFPFMVLSLMLVSRVKHPSPALLMLLSWGGGSPTGARLLADTGVSRRDRVRLAVSCATMSPMFLRGTVGGWLSSDPGGWVVLLSVLLGGWLAGRAAGRFTPDAPGTASALSAGTPLSLSAAVEQSARTMLLVCGTMMLLRVVSAMAAEILPPMLALPVLTLLEVTSGAAQIAALPLPLPLRTALIAGAAGFGGLGILLQNRSFYPPGMLSIGRQTLWQALHGAISFVMALGMMTLLC